MPPEPNTPTERAAAIAAQHRRQTKSIAGEFYKSAEGDFEPVDGIESELKRLAVEERYAMRQVERIFAAETDPCPLPKDDHLSALAEKAEREREDDETTAYLISQRDMLPHRPSISALTEYSGGYSGEGPTTQREPHCVARRPRSDVACGKPLTGRQQVTCSEECRKRLTRHGPAPKPPH
jgi:hypothetical protein